MSLKCLGGCEHKGVALFGSPSTFGSILKDPSNRGCQPSTYKLEARRSFHHPALRMSTQMLFSGSPLTGTSYADSVASKSWPPQQSMAEQSMAESVSHELYSKLLKGGYIGEGY